MKKKESGAIHFIVIFMMFLMLLLLLCLYYMQCRQVKFIKYEVDNDVILAALAADTADIYEYTTYYDLDSDEGVVVLDTKEEKGYGEWNDDTAFVAGCNKAYSVALDRFHTAIQTNLNLTKIDDSTYSSNLEDYDNIKLEKFIVYNVKVDKVYVCKGVGNISVGDIGTIQTPLGDTVQSSGIYVEMNFDIKALGQTFPMKVQEFVDFVGS